MKTTTLIIAIVIILIPISLILFSGDSAENTFNSIINPNDDNDEDETPNPTTNPINQGNQKTNPPNSPSTIETTTSGQSSGGSSSESSSQNCQESLISYSLTNLVKEETCNVLENEICIDKTISCSLIVSNLEEDVTGLFTIRLDYFPTDDRQNILGSEEISINLEANEQQQINSQVNILGEDANQEFSCSFHSVTIPTITICS